MLTFNWLRAGWFSNKSSVDRWNSTSKQQTPRVEAEITVPGDKSLFRIPQRRHYRGASNIALHGFLSNEDCQYELTRAPLGIQSNVNGRARRPRKEACSHRPAEDQLTAGIQPQPCGCWLAFSRSQTFESRLVGGLRRCPGPADGSCDLTSRCSKWERALWRKDRTNAWR